MADIQEWVTVQHDGHRMAVTVTLREDNLTARFKMPCYMSSVKVKTKMARANAKKILEHMKEELNERA